MTLVLLMKVPWDQANQRHKAVIKLVDSDGQAPLVGQDQNGNPAPLQIMGEFEVGRPAGLPPGTALDNSLVINLGPGIPLNPGSTYEWRVEVDDEEVAVRSFFVRPN